MRSSTWKHAELRIAAILGGRRVPITGRARGDQPDIEHAYLSLEVKHRKGIPKWLLTALDQADAAAIGTSKKSAVVLHLPGTPYNHSLVIMRLEDFALLTTKEQ